MWSQSYTDSITIPKVILFHQIVNPRIIAFAITICYNDEKHQRGY